MKKRVTVLIAGVLCIACLAAAAAVAVKDISAQLRPDFSIVVDGVEREFKNAQGEVVYPILYDGTTYLPVRAIGELMGKTVYWYEGDKRIELKDSSTTVTDADVIVPDTGSDNTTVQPPEVTLPVQPKPPVETAAADAAFIGKEKAQEIALAKAGITADGVTFDRTELDEDDGLWHYEVEFRKGITEYEADIKADDGTIISFEKDIYD